MNAIATTERSALSLSEAELLDVMEASLFPGANRQSIKLVLGYCTARNLDPMLKPAHIVPMRCKKAGTRDQYEWRDTVMPAIGLYRIQAARTGEHAGTDEPVYGPMLELRVGDFTLQYPEWCSVTVYRMKNGQRYAYTAREYWLENYATQGSDTMMPNAMWKKRTRGQIAKCAEAQALRKGFPEVGNQPTADEMEGKSYDFDLEANGELKTAQGGQSASAPAVAALPAYAQSDFDKNLETWRGVIESGRKSPDELIAWLSTRATLSDQQQAKLRELQPVDSSDAIGGQPAQTSDEARQ